MSKVYLEFSALIEGTTEAKGISKIDFRILPQNIKVYMQEFR